MIEPLDDDHHHFRSGERFDFHLVLVGRAKYEAPDTETLTPYWPLLPAGEVVHVGKGAVMGLGRYGVETM